MGASDDNDGGDSRGDVACTEREGAALDGAVARAVSNAVALVLGRWRWRAGKASDECCGRHTMLGCAVCVCGSGGQGEAMRTNRGARALPATPRRHRQKEAKTTARAEADR